MGIPMSRRLTMFAVSCVLAVPCLASAQQDASAGSNMAAMTFGPVPGLPTCAPGSVQSGDPRTGPSFILAKVAAGCVIPWHWHTPNEHLMIVSGIVRLETKDGKPLTLQAGGFATMAARHAHLFRCTSACVFYVYTDAAFDIHYVDSLGHDVSPLEALNAVNETVAGP